MTHPWQFVLFAFAVVVGLEQWTIVTPLILVVVVELVALILPARLPAFRRFVDAQCAQIARGRAAEERSRLLSQMCDAHRKELLSLEAVIDRTRDASKPYGPAAQAVVDECLGLLSSYVRLAIAYNVSRECQVSVNRQELAEQVRKLEAMASSGAESTREVARRRLHIARQRALCWDRSSESLEAVAQELAMIGDLVRLTHEQLAAPTATFLRVEEIDGALEVLDGAAGADDELARLLRIEPVVDPDVLDMGRTDRD